MGTARIDSLSCEIYSKILTFVSVTKRFREDAGSNKYIYANTQPSSYVNVTVILFDTQEFRYT